MDCQIEPLFIQYEVMWTVPLVYRSTLFDEMNHVVHEAGNLLDSVGLEMGNVSIRIFIVLAVSVFSKHNGIPCNHMVSVIINTLVEYPFLDPLSNLCSDRMTQEIGDCMNPFRAQGFFLCWNTFRAFMLLGGGNCLWR